MYIIITKNKKIADYAQKMECDVFRDDDVIVVGKGAEKSNTEIFLTSLFGMLAIDPDIKGYDYLKYVLRKCIEEEGYYKQLMTRVVYPEVAKEFGTTISRAERAMRHAIETSFAEVPEMYTKIFNRELREPPATSKFIGMLAVYIQNILAEA